VEDAGLLEIAYLTTFGEFVRKARLEKGLRSKDVARSTKLDYTANPALKR